MTLMIAFQSIYIQLYQTYKNFQERVQTGLLIQSQIIHLVFESIIPQLGGSYVKLLKELDHPRRGLINIQNIYCNECFKWCSVRQINPADHHQGGITKSDKDFVKKLDFKDIKFPVKVRDIHKVEKKNSIGVSVFSYQNKKKHPICVSKKYFEEKHFDLILIAEKGKIYYFPIKDFNTFMYNHTLNRIKEHFCRYCLQTFSAEEILKRHIKACFKINGKRKIKMPKRGKYVKFKY